MFSGRVGAYVRLVLILIYLYVVTYSLLLLILIFIVAISCTIVHYYTATHREGAILQSPCPFVRLFTLSLKMSQLLLEEMILFFIHDFGIVTCTMSYLSRLTAHLLPVYGAS